MANAYTPNFRYRMPAIGDEFWADEFYQNQEIKDAVTKNHLVGARVSGLLVTVNSGLSISWEAGQVLVNDITYAVNSGSAILPPSGNVDILVPVYIYTDGVNVAASAAVPTLSNGTLLAVADTDTQQIVALADTRVIGDLFEQNDTFYVDVNGDDNASGSATEPWATLENAMNNLTEKKFPRKASITLNVSTGDYIHDYSEGLLLPTLLNPLTILGDETQNPVFIIGAQFPITTPINSFDLRGHTNNITLKNLILRGNSVEANQYDITAIGISSCLNVILDNITIEWATNGISSNKSLTNIVNCNISDVIEYCVEAIDGSHVYMDNTTSTRCGKYRAISQSFLELSACSIHDLPSTHYAVVSDNSSHVELLQVNITGSGAGGSALLYSYSGSFINCNGLYAVDVDNTTTAEARDQSFIDILDNINNYTGSLIPPGNTVGNYNSFVKGVA